MKTYARIRMWVMVLSFAGLVSPVAAQTPQLELGIGYQTSHIPENWNPIGFNLDIAAPAMDKLSVVGEVGMTKDSEDAAGIVSATLSDWNFGGGVRYSANTSPANVYGQVIVGGLRRSIDFDVIGIGIGDSTTAFMIQPGVGFTFPLTGGVLFGVDLSYRRAFFEDEGENQFRIVAGVHLGLSR